MVNYNILSKYTIIKVVIRVIMTHGYVVGCLLKKQGAKLNAIFDSDYINMYYIRLYLWCI